MPLIRLSRLHAINYTGIMIGSLGPSSNTRPPPPEGGRANGGREEARNARGTEKIPYFRETGGWAATKCRELVRGAHVSARTRARIVRKYRVHA